MLVEIGFAGLLSAVSLILLAIALRRRFWTFVGAQLVVAAVVFHFVSEIVTAISPERNDYRSSHLGEDTDLRTWLLFVGPALLVFTMSYLLVLGRGRKQHPQSDNTNNERTIAFFDWRYCLIATVPLYLLALQGRGFVPGATQEGEYFSAGITKQFLVFGIVMTSFAVVSRYGHFGLIVVGQSVALILLGQRLAIITGLASLCLLLVRHGRRPDRRQVATILVVGLVGAVTLSAARVNVGRTGYAGGSGPAARVQSTFAGFGGLFRASTWTTLADDYVYRIDGNTFPALVMQAQNNGAAPVGMSTVANSLVLATPAFLYPAKRNIPEGSRDEIGFIQNKNAISTSTGFLPTLFGGAVAYFGPWWLMVVMAAFGAVVAALDRWLRLGGPARSLIAVGALSCVLYYERGFQVIPLTMRGALSLALAVWCIRQVHAVSRRAVRPTSATVRVHQNV